MYKFTNETELLNHARDHVEQAVNSLNRDVKNCLKNELEPAPFPAVLFCFATINLLGALVTGRADIGADDKLVSICYMTRFMQYSTENATILIELFRHKLVHLAQPNPLIQFGSERITWQHHHHDRQFHLKKIAYQGVREIGGDVPSHWHIPVTHQFNISITDFAKDIRDSAMGRNGYYNALENSPYLQINYELAINRMYGEKT
ncbi:MAG: hypothetical protein ACRD47_10060 [Nitrososphaeraceae archaeon]